MQSITIDEALAYSLKGRIIRCQTRKIAGEIQRVDYTRDTITFDICPSAHFSEVDQDTWRKHSDCGDKFEIPRSARCMVHMGTIQLDHGTTSYWIHEDTFTPTYTLG